MQATPMIIIRYYFITDHDIKHIVCWSQSLGKTLFVLNRFLLFVKGKGAIILVYLYILMFYINKEQWRI